MVGSRGNPPKPQGVGSLPRQGAEYLATVGASRGSPASPAGGPSVRRPRAPRWGLVGSLGFLLLAGLLGFLVHRQADAALEVTIRRRLEVLAEGAAERFLAGVASAVEVLHYGRGLFDASDEVTRDEFLAFMGPTLRRHPALLAVGWAEREPASGPTTPYAPRFVLWREDTPTLDPTGPLTGGVGAQALDRATASQSVALSDPVPVGCGEERCLATLAALPVASRTAPGPGREAGCLVGLLRLADLLASAAIALPWGEPARAACLLGEGSGRALAAWPRQGAPPCDAGVHATRSVRVGGRTWTLRVVPRAGFVGEAEGRRPLGLGLAAFAGCLLLGLGARAWGRAARARGRLAQASLLERVLEELDEGIVVADATGRLRPANPAALRILGGAFPSTEAAAWEPDGTFFGRDGRTRLPPDEHPARRALRGARVDAQEYLLRRSGSSDGVWVGVSARPLRVDERGEQGALLVVRDLTERRRVESGLRRLSSAVEQTYDAVLVSDHHGRILYVNPAFEALTGHARDEAVASPPGALEASLYDEGVAAAVRARVQEGRPFRGTVRLHRRDGEVLDAEQTVAPVRDAAGHIAFQVTVARDASARHRYERQEIERRLAADLQRRLYPARAPVIAGFEVAARVVPAEAMCGDGYDLLPAADGSLVLAVGDVTGHGLLASLIMLQVRAYLRAILVRPEVEPAAALGILNGHLCRDLPLDKFVTLVLVRVEGTARRLTYASAGHVAGLLVDARGRLKARLPSTGPPLGVAPDARYGSPPACTAEAGDALVLVTDGVIESRRADGAEFDEDGVLGVLADLPGASPVEISDALDARLRAFSGLPTPRDDVTMVVGRWTGD